MGNNDYNRNDFQSYQSSYGDQSVPNDYYAQNDTTVGRVNQNIMSKTFLYMFVVLMISAFSAYYTASSKLATTLLLNPNLLWVFLVVELGIVFGATWTMSKNLVAPSAILLLIYSIVNGAGLSYIFYLYQMTSIVSIFFMTAVLFGAMAVVGAFIKKDLSVIGQIGMMALIGVIILSVVNIFFLKSSGFDIVLSAAGLAIFIGLTAYDTQKIKKMAAERSSLSPNVLAMFGALTLYLDFINMFLRLLRLFGRRN